MIDGSRADTLHRPGHMQAERWARIQDLFHQVVALPPSERGALLQRECAEDPDLRAEVESLLASDAASETLFDARIEDLALLMEDQETAGGPLHETAGPYRIGEEIGRGGMGAVYRADRTDGAVERTVALKVVRLDLGEADTAARFRRERQILAGLEHPNIARLYDAGVTESGNPFLAMELVEGSAIHAYCDAHRLSIPQRLRLFEQVCSAVEYAHRRLVIHRDLKPSNILVSERGEVKLLDFGIAKILEADDDPAEPLTRNDQRLFTPEYAAPEQIRGEALSASSDVYSLGVVLHQLLTGRRPEATTGDELTAPSTLVTRVPESGGDVVALAETRGTTPAALQRTLRGELDTIVIEALRSDIGQRYASVAALRSDLIRYREGRPIAARAPTLGYLTRKFVRRNRGSVIAAGLVVASLVGGLATTLTQARIAQEERELAEAVSGFMENLFTSSNPFARSAERLDTLRIGAFLTRATDRLGTDLADQPELRTRMARVLGSVHLGVGQYDDAKELLDQAIEGYRSREEISTPEFQRALTDRARLAHMSGAIPEAETLYQEALALAVEREGERSILAATLLGELASVYLSLDRPDDAAPLLSESVEIRRTEFGDDSQEVAEDLNLLGLLHYRRGDLEQAIPNVLESLSLHEDILGADHPNTLTLRQNLGLIMHRAQRYPEAEGLLRDAVRGQIEALGADHRNVLQTQKALANTLEALDQWAEADSLHSVSLAGMRRTVPTDSRDLAILLHDYGSALARHGEFTRGIALLREAVGVEERVGGPRSPGSAVSQASLASAIRSSGDPEGALHLYEDALEVLHEVFPPNHARVLGALIGQARTLADLGNTTDALEQLLAVHDVAAGLPDGGATARDAAERLAELYGALGDTAAAAEWQAAASNF